MRAGEFADGSRVLRAKIDMRHANLNMRDPRFTASSGRPTTAREQVVHLPMYDYAHPISTRWRGSRIRYAHWNSRITGRSTTGPSRTCADLPAAPDRVRAPESDLYLDEASASCCSWSRKIWSRVGTIRACASLSGLRRRGYTPEAIRAFAERIGVAKNDSIVDVGLLEFAIREDLEKRAPAGHGSAAAAESRHRNFPDGQVEWFEAANHPDNPAMGTRKIPFSKVVYIERDDFAEVPPKKCSGFRPVPRFACAGPA